jgi:hypothetical protein
MLKYRGSVFGCAEVDPALINSRPTDVEPVVLTALVLVLVLSPSFWKDPHPPNGLHKRLSRENRQVRGCSQVSARAYGRL